MKADLEAVLRQGIKPAGGHLSDEEKALPLKRSKSAYLSGCTLWQVVGIWQVGMNDELRAVALYDCCSAFCAEYMREVGTNLHVSPK